MSNDIEKRELNQDEIEAVSGGRKNPMRAETLDAIGGKQDIKKVKKAGADGPIPMRKIKGDIV